MDATTTATSIEHQTTAAPTTETARTVDARGQACPGPVVSLARVLKEIPSGSVLELFATDPGSKTDIPAWAEISGNELLEASEADGTFRYLIRKR